MRYHKTKRLLMRLLNRSDFNNLKGIQYLEKTRCQ